MPKQVVAGLRDFTPQYDFGVLLDGEGWVEAYATGSDVANMCRNLLASSSTFTASTVPTQAAVNSYLSSGCGILESTLQSKGYTVPVASGTAARDWLRNLNMLYAAGMSELTRINITLTPGERTRGQVLLDYFWKQLGQFTALDLTTMGVTRSTSRGTLFVGGISEASKDTYDTDSDRIAPRFARGMFATSGALTPTSNNTTSNETD